jgi:hypothetical protein
MMMYGGSGPIVLPFMTAALAGGEWLASCPDHFTPGKELPSTHWIGGCVGPRAGPDTVEERKIPCPYWESNPSHPACSLSLCWKLSQLLLKKVGITWCVWCGLVEVVGVTLYSWKYRYAINVSAKYNTEVNLISCWDLWNSLVRHISYGRSWERTVSIARLRAGLLKGQSSSPGGGKIFLLSMSSRPVLGPTQPPSAWVPGALSLGQSGQGVELTTHFQLVSRSRICRSVDPLPHTSS